jgi:hypothetical protein
MFDWTLEGKSQRLKRVGLRDLIVSFLQLHAKYETGAHTAESLVSVVRFGAGY